MASITMDVLTAINERQVAMDARKLTTLFTDAGGQAGKGFGESMASSLAGFSTKIAEALAVPAAMTAVATFAVHVGEAYEEMARQVTLHTAAMGDALEDLQYKAASLVPTLDVSTKNLGADFATLATRLQDTGPAVSDLTRHFEMLSDRFGHLDVNALAGAFVNMGVNGAKVADDALASLVARAQEFAVPLPKLITDLSQFSSVFAELGLNTDQAGLMLAELEAKGVPAIKAITGLEMGMTKARDSGKDFATFMHQIGDSMAYYKEKGDTAALEDISLALGGGRRWAELEKSVDAYNDAIGRSSESLKGHGDKLDELGKKTQTIGDHWTEMGNKMQDAFKPAGDAAIGILDAIIDKIGQAIDWMNRLGSGGGWKTGSGPEPGHVGPPLSSLLVPGGGPGAGPMQLPGIPMNIPGMGAGAPPPAYGPAPGTAGPGGGPPSDLITPGDLEKGGKGKKGPRLPEAPEIPYGAGYGAPPRPGETAEQYSHEQNILEKRHELEMARARLHQLEQTNNATADDIQKARNKVLHSQEELNHAELEASNKHIKNIETMSSVLGTVDISKGWAGVIEYVTKFFASLAMAPAMGALAAVSAQSGVTSGAGKGLLGIGAAMGAFGEDYMPGPEGYGGGAPRISRSGVSPRRNTYRIGGEGGEGYGGGDGGESYWPGYGSSGGQSYWPGYGAQGASGDGMSGINLSTIPVAVQRYANDCIDASAKIILSHAGINMSEEQLENVISPGGTIESQAAGLNRLDPAGRFAAIPGSGGSAGALFSAIKASIDSGTGSILNVAPGSSIAGKPFSEGHFIAVTGYNPDGTLNLSDTARGTHYSVSAADAFQATQGRGIVAGSGLPPIPRMNSGGEVPIIAHSGEFIVNADSAAKYGGVLRWINAQRYDDGGDIKDRYGAGGTTKIGGAAPPQGYGGGLPGGGGGAGVTAIGGAAPALTGGGGASAVGGGAAAGAGAGAATMGIGIAAQIAMQEIQRGIQYGGALAGIGVSALQQTFSLGSSQLSHSGWGAKIAGGLMGAQPQLPNMAGKHEGFTPGQDAHGQGPGPESMVGPGAGMPSADVHNYNAAPAVHIEHYHVDETENKAGADLARHNEVGNAPIRGQSGSG